MSDYPYENEGCSNHGCEIAPVPKGAMGTNSMCRCVRDKPHIASGVIRWQRQRIADLERQLAYKPIGKIQEVADALRNPCGVTAARQREAADLIEFLCRENGRIQRKAEQQLAEAQSDLRKLKGWLWRYKGMESTEWIEAALGTGVNDETL